jgi:hypothetical protein
MKINTQYVAITLYLNSITDIKHCKIEDIIISNPKKVISHTAKKGKYEVLFYRF